MIGFDKEKLMWTRPKCAKEGCNGEGIAVIPNGKALCSGCFIKYEQKRMAYLKESANQLMSDL